MWLLIKGGCCLTLNIWSWWCLFCKIYFSNSTKSYIFIFPVIACLWSSYANIGWADIWKNWWMAVWQKIVSSFTATKKSLIAPSRSSWKCGMCTSFSIILVWLMSFLLKVFWLIHIYGISELPCWKRKILCHSIRNSLFTFSLLFFLTAKFNCVG
jgi:hypothetical protein